MTKPVKVTLLIVLVLALLAVLGATLATRVVESRILAVLGEQGHAARIHVRPSEIVLEGLEVGAPPDWPVRQTLRAARVVVIPHWSSMLSDELSLDRITITDYYLSVLRPRTGGIRYMPTLREHRNEEPAAHDANGHQRRRPVNIGKLELRDGRLDFFDATMATPPYRVPVEKLNADIGPIPIRDPDNPQADAHTQLQAQGQMVGKNRRGKVELDGWISLPGHDLDIQARLRSVDVALLAPYLQRKAPAALAGGQVDLDMHTKVEKQRLQAKGTITLTDLAFDNSNAPLLALPRKVVMAALEDRKGKVSFDFSLSGNLQDPKFSMDDSLAAQFTSGFAKAIGVSVQGVAGGVEEAIKGLGDALDNLLHK